MRRLLLLGAACAGLAGCNTAGSGSTAGLPALNVAFTWCSGSPTFSVGNVPAATKTLNFRMIDQQAQGYPHGGGSVAFTGKGSAQIPCGSLNGTYQGPSPPPPQMHEYEWTVTALDAGGTAIAIGRAKRKFPE